MRIQLLQASLGRREKLVYPLGIAVLGTWLEVKGGHDVRCFDLNTVDDTQQMLESLLSSGQADMIGLSLRNIDTTQTRDLFYYYDDFIEQLRVVRRLAPDATILVGGAGFSLYAERIMNDNPEIDFGVYREGEQTMLELCNGISHPEQVPGLWFRRDGQVRFSGPRQPFDLRQLPPVRWGILDIGPYHTIPGAFGVETKRGCLLHCEYCTYPFLDGPTIRHHPVERVMFEIESLVTQHHITDFTFVDSVFNIPLDHAREVCQAIVQRHLPVTWVGWFNERTLDESFIDLCVRAGCREFSFSPDGFTARTLRELGKSSSCDDIFKTFRIARKRHDVNVSYNFVGNPPGQSFSGLMKLFIFMVRCKLTLRDRLKGFSITNLRIEPNTGIYQRSIHEGIIDVDTDLLPGDTADLRKLFYSNPTTGYLNWFLNAYVMVWRWRKFLQSLCGIRTNT